MSNKRFLVTMAIVAIALARVTAYAEAPVITNPPDVIIGDLEQGAANNVFVFADAINLDNLVTDDQTPDASIEWSYVLSDGEIGLNGCAQLSGGNPNSPAAGEHLRQTNAETQGGEDGNAATVTFRNYGLSPGVDSTGPFAEPGTTGVLPAETRTVTLFASDGSTYSQTSLVVYTANDTSDSLSGGNLLVPVINLDFENNPGDRSGWFGAVLGGMGSTSIATGLCMSVPAGADPNSALGWVSPPFLAPGPNFIQLVDKALYRVRLTLYTNQTADSAIPYCDWQWSNYVQTANDGNSYGGLYWLLDVAGGATGIGRNQSDFNIWITPNAALTAQWRGLIDPANGAFNASVDFKNDFSFTFRVLHDNTSLNTAADSGTICLRRLRVDRVSLDQITTTPLFGPPISATDYFRDPNDFGTATNGTFVIDGVNHLANIACTADPSAAGANGAGARKKLVYFTAGANINQQVYPVQWVQGRLYETRVLIRSNVGGPTGTVEGTDPIDAIFIDYTVPTSETGAYHWTAKGSNNNFLRAASPRLAATTAGFGGVQPYVAYFEGTYPSTAAQIAPSFADSDRIRGFIDFFNTGPLAPLGTSTDGLDAVTVTGESINQVDTSSLQ